MRDFLRRLRMTAFEYREKQLLANLDHILWDQLRIIADAYEEADQPDLARAYRFFAQNKMAPLRHSIWYHWRRNNDLYLPLGHALPTEIIVEMAKRPPRIGKGVTEFENMAEDYKAAAEDFVSSGYIPDDLPF
jgi:hypothetical protein